MKEKEAVLAEQKIPLQEPESERSCPRVCWSKNVCVLSRCVTVRPQPPVMALGGEPSGGD